MPLRGFHSILIFERIPHLFYVNTTKYIVEARDFEQEQKENNNISQSNSSTQNTTTAKRTAHYLMKMTTLLVRTSPCPNELRFIIDNLVQPVPLQLVERELPKDIKNRIKCFFASLKDFVYAHSAYLFLDGDDPVILCSHRLHQASLIDQQTLSLLEKDDGLDLPQSSSSSHNNEMFVDDGNSSSSTSFGNNQNDQNDGYVVADATNETQRKSDGFSPFAPLSDRFKQGFVKPPNPFDSSSQQHSQQSSPEQQQNQSKAQIKRALENAAIEVSKYLPEGYGLTVTALRRRLPSELDSFVFKKHPRNFFDMFPDLFFTFNLYGRPDTPYVQHAAFPRPVNAIPRVRNDADAIRVIAAMTIIRPQCLDILFSRLPADARQVIEKMTPGTSAGTSANQYMNNRRGGVVTFSVIALQQQKVFSSTTKGEKTNNTNTNTNTTPQVTSEGTRMLEFINLKYRRFFVIFTDKYTGEPACQYCGHLNFEKRETMRRRLAAVGHQVAQ